MTLLLIKEVVMLGSIIGDTVGSVYEFNNIKTTEFHLLGDGCSYTDDSIMTVGGFTAGLRSRRHCVRMSSRTMVL